MTPTPDTASTAADILAGGISWSMFATIMLAALGALGTALQIIYSSVQKRIKEKFDQLKGEVDKLHEEAQQMEAAHEKIRDKWESFLKDYLQIDSTRGQKVDALFRVVDQMQESVRQIPISLNNKVEEAFEHSMSELKLYVRDVILRDQKK